MKPHHIVICGDSLYLDAIVEGLRSQVTLTVFHVDLEHKEALSHIAALAPEAVIIEAHTSQGQAALELLQQGYPLIILDLEESSVTVIEGRRTKANGMADLVQVIQNLGTTKGPRALSAPAKLPARRSRILGHLPAGKGTRRVAVEHEVKGLQTVTRVLG
ncbi:MAG: hypothetical protein BWY63_03159 [Chloroflexi bacterium ADurb.Bin360]|nr:MAG: hypothetical protein BWY63_03159 [Chloroflexi bacterium ADurb.Bin360]